MKKAAAADVKARFATFLNESNNGPVIITRDGKPIAVLMGVHDEDELDRLIFASSRRLHQILEAGRTEVREGRGIPYRTRNSGSKLSQSRPSCKRENEERKRRARLEEFRVPLRYRH
jgi:prevent-host-death family protein